MFDREWKSYLAAIPAVLEYSRTGRKDLALRESLVGVRPHIKAASQALEEIVALNNASGETAIAQERPPPPARSGSCWRSAPSPSCSRPRSAR